MTPAFSSWEAFFAMSGYGFFIWLALSIAIVAMVGLIIHTRVTKNSLLKEIARREQREQRIAAAQKHTEETAHERT